jgi:DsbC/DsbD-like thiol-disulfide interchange protein
MKKRIYPAVISLLIFTAAAVSADAQTVTGSISGGSIDRGDSGRGSVVLNIPGGLHVNSNRPASEYAIPTVVTVRGPRGVRVSGVTYPRGKNRRFQFSENLINVYEGRVNFPFRVTVPASFRGNSVRLTATVRYQACTDEVCYPPRSKTVVINARVN